MDAMVKDRKIRITIIKKSFWYFFHFYLPHYIRYKTAPFHREMFSIAENESVKTVVIEAFRNSAKTTIMTLAYPIWAIIGCQQKKFIVILAQTQQQARQILSNIKREMESNMLLRADLGPFEEPDDEWRAVSLVIPRYGARITVASIDQSVRGLRHGPYRPDLIICDDLEDLDSVRSRDMRDKLYEWLVGDIIPLGDVNTRLIVVGTRLHEDSLIMRLRKLISEKRVNGIARTYPLIDGQGNIAWPGKYPNEETIEKEKQRVGDERAWRREYCLEIVGDTDQVIDQTWIHYYDNLPIKKGAYITLTAIDLAISESNRADYTAMVTANIYIIDGQIYVYILEPIVNERLTYPDILERAQIVYSAFHKSGGVIIVEDVGFQKSLVQDLEAMGYNAVSFKPGGADKRMRLSLTAGMVKSGHVLFPRKGAELLIDQIVHLGQEKHDDLADAFSMLVIKSETYRPYTASDFVVLV